jgi:hypothetical protein
MTPELISSVAGIVLSLAFTFVPGLSQWYDPLEKSKKQLIMLGALALVTAGAIVLACVGWFNSPATCDQVGIEQAVTAFFLAAVANQTAYKLTGK